MILRPKKGRYTLTERVRKTTGAARASWTQISIGASVRPWKDLKPIALYALGGLPAAEHLEYHEAGPSNPSVTLRPFEKTEFEPGTTVILRQPKKGRYTLTDLKGKEIVRVRAEAKLFMTFNKKTGAARASWTQISIGASVRPWKDLKPIALYALGGLPAAEHLEYHEAGPSNPSVTLRPFEKTEFEPGTTVILRQPKKGRYTLTDLKGKEIVRVRAEAKLFMTFNKKLEKYQDLKLKIHGYMADVDPANTATVEHPILVLEAEPRK